MCESQSVGREGGGGGLQGAGGVGASHVGEEVGVRAQLMDVEAVLLAVRQTSPDKRLGSRGECVIQRAAGCECVCVFLHLVLLPISSWFRSSDMCQLVTVEWILCLTQQGQWYWNYWMNMSKMAFKQIQTRLLSQLWLEDDTSADRKCLPLIVIRQHLPK